MALIQMSVMSGKLMRTVPVTVVLPIDKLSDSGEVTASDKPFKTLYLLHGVFGNHTDWVSGTGIQRWAEERDLAVVMPSGENMFYVDIPELGNFYSGFIRELVELTRRAFPLSERKEDTFIGGLSMGGYGALMNGLKYHDLFGCIVALSAVNNVEYPMEGFFYQSTPFMKAIFGEMEAAKKSEINVNWQIRQMAAEGHKDQKIYMACGREDDLLFESRGMRKEFEDGGFAITYEEGPGAHEWDFWDTYIRKALEWLPLADSTQGITSGHIK